MYANTSLSVEDLTEQYAAKQAANFVYTFEHDIDKVDMLFSNVDDPNYTIESILNQIDSGPEFEKVSSWGEFKKKLNEFCVKGSEKNRSSGILMQSWQRFKRLINNSINDDVFVNSRSMSSDQHQVYLSDEVLNINGGEMMVVDIAGLTEQLQCLVSEGHNANRMFAGEIHALHNELVPNSQRDDFEPNAIYSEMRQDLSKWAGEINKKYRRGMSEATSALRCLNQLNAEQKELEEKIDSGAITSDEKREQIADKLKQIAKKRESEEKTVRNAQVRGTFDADRKETVEKVLSQTEKAARKVTSLNKKIINADYATKHDLPTSYSRDERKLYQRIITVIDTFFIEEPKTAEKLRDAIKSELSVKKK